MTSVERRWRSEAEVRKRRGEEEWDDGGKRECGVNKCAKAGNGPTLNDKVRERFLPVRRVALKISDVKLGCFTIQLIESVCKQPLNDSFQT